MQKHWSYKNHTTYAADKLLCQTIGKYWKKYKENSEKVEAGLVSLGFVFHILVKRIIKDKMVMHINQCVLCMDFTATIIPIHF